MMLRKVLWILMLVFLIQMQETEQKSLYRQKHKNVRKSHSKNSRPFLRRKTSVLEETHSDLYEFNKPFGFVHNTHELEGRTNRKHGMGTEEIYAEDENIKKPIVMKDIKLKADASFASALENELSIRKLMEELVVKSKLLDAEFAKESGEAAIEIKKPNSSENALIQGLEEYAKLVGNQTIEKPMFESANHTVKVDIMKLFKGMTNQTKGSDLNEKPMQEEALKKAIMQHYWQQVLKKANAIEVEKQKSEEEKFPGTKKDQLNTILKADSKSSSENFLKLSTSPVNTLLEKDDSSVTSAEKLLMPTLQLQNVEGTIKPETITANSEENQSATTFETKKDDKSQNLKQKLNTTAKLETQTEKPVEFAEAKTLSDNIDDDDDLLIATIEDEGNEINTVQPAYDIQDRSNALIRILNKEDLKEILKHQNEDGQFNLTSVSSEPHPEEIVALHLDDETLKNQLDFLQQNAPKIQKHKEVLSNKNVLLDTGVSAKNDTELEADFQQALQAQLSKLGEKLKNVIDFSKLFANLTKADSVEEIVEVPVKQTNFNNEEETLELPQQIQFYNEEFEPSLILEQPVTTTDNSIKQVPSIQHALVVNLKTTETPVVITKTTTEETLETTILLPKEDSNVRETSTAVSKIEETTTEFTVSKEKPTESLVIEMEETTKLLPKEDSSIRETLSTTAKIEAASTELTVSKEKPTESLDIETEETTKLLPKEDSSVRETLSTTAKIEAASTELTVSKEKPTESLDIEMEETEVPWLENINQTLYTISLDKSKEDIKTLPTVYINKDEYSKDNETIETYLSTPPKSTFKEKVKETPAYEILKEDIAPTKNTTEQLTEEDSSSEKEKLNVSMFENLEEVKTNVTEDATINLDKAIFETSTENIADDIILLEGFKPVENSSVFEKDFTVKADHLNKEHVEETTVSYQIYDDETNTEKLVEKPVLDIISNVTGYLAENESTTKTSITKATEVNEMEAEEVLQTTMNPEVVKVKDAIEITEEYSTEPNYLNKLMETTTAALSTKEEDDIGEEADLETTTLQSLIQKLKVGDHVSGQVVDLKLGSAANTTNLLGSGNLDLNNPGSKILTGKEGIKEETVKETDEVTPLQYNTTEKTADLEEVSLEKETDKDNMRLKQPSKKQSDKPVEKENANHTEKGTQQVKDDSKAGLHIKLNEHMGEEATKQVNKKTEEKLVAFKDNMGLYVKVKLENLKEKPTKLNKNNTENIENKREKITEVAESSEKGVKKQSELQESPQIKNEITGVPLESSNDQLMNISIANVKKKFNIAESQFMYDKLEENLKDGILPGSSEYLENENIENTTTVEQEKISEETTEELVAFDKGNEEEVKMEVSTAVYLSLGYGDETREEMMDQPSLMNNGKEKIKFMNETAAEEYEETTNANNEEQTTVDNDKKVKENSEKSSEAGDANIPNEMIQELTAAEGIIEKLGNTNDKKSTAFEKDTEKEVKMEVATAAYNVGVDEEDLSLGYSDETKEEATDLPSLMNNDKEKIMFMNETSAEGYDETADANNVEQTVVDNDKKVKENTKESAEVSNVNVPNEIVQDLTAAEGITEKLENTNDKKSTAFEKDTEKEVKLEVATAAYNVGVDEEDSSLGYSDETKEEATDLPSLMNNGKEKIMFMNETSAEGYDETTVTNIEEQTAVDNDKEVKENTEESTEVGDISNEMVQELTTAEEIIEKLGNTNDKESTAYDKDIEKEVKMEVTTAVYNDGVIEEELSFGSSDKAKEEEMDKPSLMDNDKEKVKLVNETTAEGYDKIAKANKEKLTAVENYEKVKEDSEESSEDSYVDIPIELIQELVAADEFKVDMGNKDSKESIAEDIGEGGEGNTEKFVEAGFQNTKDEKVQQNASVVGTKVSTAEDKNKENVKFVEELSAEDLNLASTASIKQTTVKEELPVVGAKIENNYQLKEEISAESLTIKNGTITKEEAEKVNEKNVLENSNTTEKVTKIKGESIAEENKDIAEEKLEKNYQSTEKITMAILSAENDNMATVDNENLENVEIENTTAESNNKLEEEFSTIDTKKETEVEIKEETTAPVKHKFGENLIKISSAVYNNENIAENSEEKLVENNDDIKGDEKVESKYEIKTNVEDIDNIKTVGEKMVEEMPTKDNGSGEIFKGITAQGSNKNKDKEIVKESIIEEISENEGVKVEPIKIAYSEVIDSNKGEIMMEDNSSEEIRDDISTEDNDSIQENNAAKATTPVEPIKIAVSEVTDSNKDEIMMEGNSSEEIRDDNSTEDNVSIKENNAAKATTPSNDMSQETILIETESKLNEEIQKGLAMEDKAKVDIDKVKEVLMTVSSNEAQNNLEKMTKQELKVEHEDQIEAAKIKEAATVDTNMLKEKIKMETLTGENKLEVKGIIEDSVEKKNILQEAMATDGQKVKQEAMESLESQKNVTELSTIGQDKIKGYNVESNFKTNEETMPLTVVKTEKLVEALDKTIDKNTTNEKKRKQNTKRREKPEIKDDEQTTEDDKTKSEISTVLENSSAAIEEVTIYPKFDKIQEENKPSKLNKLHLPNTVQYKVQPDSTVNNMKSNLEHNVEKTQTVQTDKEKLKQMEINIAKKNNTLNSGEKLKENTNKLRIILSTEQNAEQEMKHNTLKPTDKFPDMTKTLLTEVEDKQNVKIDKGVLKQIEINVAKKQIVKENMQNTPTSNDELRVIVSKKDIEDAAGSENHSETEKKISEKRTEDMKFIETKQNNDEGLTKTKSNSTSDNKNSIKKQQTSSNIEAQKLNEDVSSTVNCVTGDSVDIAMDAAVKNNQGNSKRLADDSIKTSAIKRIGLVLTEQQIEENENNKSIEKELNDENDKVAMATATAIVVDEVDDTDAVVVNNFTDETDDVTTLKPVSLIWQEDNSSMQQESNEDEEQQEAHDSDEFDIADNEDDDAAEIETEVAENIKYDKIEDKNQMFADNINEQDKMKHINVAEINHHIDAFVDNIDNTAENTADNTMPYENQKSPPTNEKLPAPTELTVTVAANTKKAAIDYDVKNADVYQADDDVDNDDGNIAGFADTTQYHANVQNIAALDEQQHPISNWWNTLHHAEIRKFLNSIFNDAADEFYQEIARQARVELQEMPPQRQSVLRQNHRKGSAAAQWLDDAWSLW